MKFGLFQKFCKYNLPGAVEGVDSMFEPTCRKPDRIPEGDSWGKCDEEHCPLYGITVHGKNGILTSDDGVAVKVSEFTARVVLK